MQSYYLKFKLFILFFFIGLLFPSQAFAHQAAGNVTIHMDEKGFAPSQITISVGEKVTFENVGKEEHWPASNIHPTHSVYSEFDPKKGIKPGETWTFIFDKEGAWRFHDHLFAEFTGVVTVKGEEKKELSFFEKITAFFKQFFPGEKQKEKKETYVYNASIAKADTSIAYKKEALFSYVKKFGTKQAMEHLVSVEHTLGRDCHENAHALGKFAYEIYGEKTFAACTADCHSGCYHGATEAFFQEHGTADLDKNLKIICGNGLNVFFAHQCLHGVGHGLMAWSDYDIHKALKDCDLLSRGQDSCYSGVFMENIVGGLALDGKENTTEASSRHYTKYLNDDPQYPCTVVDDKYKSGCYFYQSSRMVQLLNYDFDKVTKACLDASAEYQGICIESMGRDISGFTRRDPEKTIALCQTVPYGDLRRHCLMGAVQDTFWEKSGQTVALAFCKLLIDNQEKEACYVMITERASQVLMTEQEKKQFCQQMEDPYNEICHSIVKPIE
jgi:plastocyanin